MILHGKALYNLIWIIIFLWVLKTSNILNRRIFLQHSTGSCYNVYVMYEFIWLTCIECRLISSKVLLWHCISYFPYNICIVRIHFDMSLSIVEFLMERVSNILAFMQFMGCGGFFSPTNGYHFNGIFFFSSAKSRPGAYLCCYCCSATVISSLGLTVAFSPGEQRCKKDRCIDPQRIIRSCHTPTLKSW